MNTKASQRNVIYYNSLTDDIVKSKQQDFTLPSNYQIIKRTPLNYLMRFLATGFAYLFTYGVMHVKVIGRDSYLNINIKAILSMEITLKWLMMPLCL